MASENRGKRLIFRRIATKSFVAVVLFFAIVAFFECLMVWFFSFSGLTDIFAFDFFTISISPLFHLMPLGVMFVLFSSWMYLTKYVGVVPRRMLPSKKPLERHRRRIRRRQKTLFGQFRNFLTKIGRTLGRVGRAFKAFFRRIGGVFLRSRGVSSARKRPFLARPAVKSTATVLTVFLVSVLSLYFLVHPNLLHDLATGLYGANPVFHGFVLKTIEMAKGFAQAFFPIGWLASTVDGALRAVAPGFRNIVEGFRTPATDSFANLDLVGKYILCQNVAAWISAIVVLGYGEYASRLHRIYKPR